MGIMTNLKIENDLQRDILASKGIVKTLRNGSLFEGQHYPAIIEHASGQVGPGFSINRVWGYANDYFGVNLDNLSYNENWKENRLEAADKIQAAIDEYDAGKTPEPDFAQRRRDLDRALLDFHKYPEKWAVDEIETILSSRITKHRTNLYFGLKQTYRGDDRREYAQLLRETFPGDFDGWDWVEFEDDGDSIIALTEDRELLYTIAIGNGKIPNMPCENKNLSENTRQIINAKIDELRAEQEPKILGGIDHTDLGSFSLIKPDELEALKTERDDLKAKVEMLKKQLETSRTQRKNQSIELARLNPENKALKVRVAELEKDIQRCSRIAEKDGEEYAGLRKQNTELQKFSPHQPTLDLLSEKFGDDYGSMYYGLCNLIEIDSAFEGIEPPEKCSSAYHDMAGWYVVDVKPCYKYKLAQEKDGSRFAVWVERHQFLTPEQMAQQAENLSTWQARELEERGTE